MGAEKINIEVELTFEDFFRNIFWQTLRKTWLIFFLAIILLPLVIFNVYGMVSSGKFSPLIFLPFVPVLAVLFVLYSIYSSAKKTAETAKHKIQWSFSDRGYENFTANSKSKVSWNEIEEVIETNKDFLIFPQKPIFIIIPKRFFVDAQIKEVKGIIRQRFARKAKLKE